MTAIIRGMTASLWIVAPVVLGAALFVAAAFIGREKDRLTALASEPALAAGAEYNFDFDYRNDRAAGEREKHKLHADLLQPVILATNIAAGISTVAAAVPQFAIVCMIASLLIVAASVLRERILYRSESALVDASTEYGIFYQKAKYLGVVTIRERFSEEYPQHAKLLKPQWDRDSTQYPAVPI